MKRLSGLRAGATWTRPLLVLVVGVVLACASLSAFAAAPAHADAASDKAQVAKCRQIFFGLVPWYQYLGGRFKGGSGPDNCDIKCFNVTDQGAGAVDQCGDGKSDLPLILLAVIDDMLRIAAFMAIAYVFYGAFQYVGSQGDPDGTSRAQKTVINSLVGLALAITSVAIVSFLGKSLGG